MEEFRISIIIHFVFSTKDQSPIGAEHIKERIWSLIGDIARENRMIPLAIGGTADHVHLLFSIPTTISIDQIIRVVKEGTTAWVREEYPFMRDFAWQEGSAAFGVSECEIDEKIAYIKNQQEIHRTKTFKEEYVELLKLNQVKYSDDETLWE